MKSDIIIMAACSVNGVIGKDGALPWHIKEDLQFFKQRTLGKPMIMGRKTRDSFGVNPLPQRPHIVLSKNKDYLAKETIIVHDFESALAKAEAFNDLHNHNEIFIIGGGELYIQAISYANKLIISEIYQEFSGDTYFPEFDKTQYKEKIIQQFPLAEIPFHVVEYEKL